MVTSRFSYASLQGAGLLVLRLSTGRQQGRTCKSSSCKQLHGSFTTDGSSWQAAKGEPRLKAHAAGRPAGQPATHADSRWERGKLPAGSRRVINMSRAWQRTAGADAQRGAPAPLIGTGAEHLGAAIIVAVVSERARRQQCGSPPMVCSYRCNLKARAVRPSSRAQAAADDPNARNRNPRPRRSTATEDDEGPRLDETVPPARAQSPERATPAGGFGAGGPGRPGGIYTRPRRSKAPSSAGFMQLPSDLPGANGCIGGAAEWASGAPRRPARRCN